MRQWKEAHGAEINIVSGSMVFTDRPVIDWHLIGLFDPSFLNRRVRLSFTAERHDTTNTCIYINLYGGIHIGFISVDGAVRLGAAEILRADKRGNAIDVVCEFICTRESIFLGTASEAFEPRYMGAGAKQWTIVDPVIDVMESDNLARKDRLVVVDVGAAGGVGEEWVPHLGRIHAVLFEPIPEEAESLQVSLNRGVASGEVYASGLSNKTGRNDLYLTKFSQCSSLLEPDLSVLSRYKVAPCFEVERKIEIDCKRYDDISSAPQPDVLKIDVQGAESLVIEGMGKFLDNILGIEIETHFYPIYKNQKTIGEMVEIMARHGLMLKRVSPQMNFDSDLVEMNAYFVRDKGIKKNQASKIDFIRQVWQIHDHDGGEKLTRDFVG